MKKISDIISLTKNIEETANKNMSLKLKRFAICSNPTNCISKIIEI